MVEPPSVTPQPKAPIEPSTSAGLAEIQTTSPDLRNVPPPLAANYTESGSSPHRTARYGLSRAAMLVA